MSPSQVTMMSIATSLGVFSGRDGFIILYYRGKNIYGKERLTSRSASVVDMEWFELTSSLVLSACRISSSLFCIFEGRKDLKQLIPF